jgi:hypothetical protein
VQRTWAVPPIALAAGPRRGPTHGGHGGDGYRHHLCGSLFGRPTYGGRRLALVRRGYLVVPGGRAGDASTEGARPVRARGQVACGLHRDSQHLRAGQRVRRARLLPGGGGLLGLGSVGWALLAVPVVGRWKTPQVGGSFRTDPATRAYITRRLAQGKPSAKPNDASRGSSPANYSGYFSTTSSGYFSTTSSSANQILKPLDAT